MLLLPPGYTIPLGPLVFSAQLLPKRNAFLPNYSLQLYSGVSVADLAPSIFRAPSLGG